MTVTQGAGRPKAGYYIDKQKVPSSTTITGRFKDSGGLIFVAKRNWHEAGARGEPFDRDAYWSDHNALEVGSAAHKRIEAWLHGDPPPPLEPEYVERVESAFSAFKEWFEAGRFEVVATELPLVSRQFMFGGTIDAILRDGKGRLAIGDWKSSNAIFEDYLWQIASYGQLWNENNDEQIAGGFHLVRFSKEHGDFAHHWFPELEDAWTTFLHLRAAYESTKSVKKRAA